MVILHLTDLHISPAHHHAFASYWTAMLQALCALPKEWQPTVVAFTGDLVCSGCREEFDLAKHELSNLFSRLYLKGEQAISCPGNHDCGLDSAGNSFVEYERLCYSLGISTNRLIVGGHSFFSLNTCHETTEEAYNRATLQEPLPQSVPDKSVVLLHHPPEMVQQKAALHTLATPGTIMLSGHTHVSRPVLTHYGNALSINGCAVYTANHLPAYGCQLIKLEPTLRIVSLTSKDALQYTFEEMKR